MRFCCALSRRLIAARPISSADVSSHSNAARGGIVNEQDLYEALSTRTIAGAALDALETEPPTKEAYGNTFYTLDNIILTPHIGAATHEIQSLSARTVVEQCAALLQGKEIENIVP